MFVNVIFYITISSFAYAFGISSSFVFSYDRLNVHMTFLCYFHVLTIVSWFVVLVIFLWLDDVFLMIFSMFFIYFWFYSSSLRCLRVLLDPLTILSYDSLAILFRLSCVFFFSYDFLMMFLCISCVFFEIRKGF